MGQNPARPFVFSAFHGDGFIHQNDGRLNMNLSEKFPDAKKGQTAYAAAMLWMDQEEEKEFQVNCYGPVRIFVNTELVFRSAVREDVNVRMEKTFRVSLKKGWNTFLFRFIQTASGFGCLFTPVEIRWNPLTFTGPFQERRDTLGFAYSEPCRDEDDDLPPAWGLQGDGSRNGASLVPRSGNGRAKSGICRLWSGFSGDPAENMCLPGLLLYGEKEKMAGFRSPSVRTAAFACGWMGNRSSVRRGKREKLYPKQRRAPGSISFSCGSLHGNGALFCGCFSHGRGREDFV